MVKRTTQPSNNKYYIRQVSGGLNGAVAGQPTISGANVLCNCVGYANGRFNEIINDPDLKGVVLSFKYQLVCNAENFIESARRQGLKISSVPTLGGIMVWQKGNTLDGWDGAGHVEVVEQINKDGSIICSSSGWNAWAFRLLARTNKNGNWGQDSPYHFRGCIVNPSIKDGEKVTEKPLVVDGVGGGLTVMALQRYLKKFEDGVLSGQVKAQNKYYKALTAVEYGGGGSATVKALQTWLGITSDGIWGRDTSIALQKRLKKEGYDIGKDGADGFFGTESMKALQRFLNDKLFPKKTTTPAKKPTASTSTKPAAKKTYSGKLPTMAQVKAASNAGIRKRIVSWCKSMAESGKYHYVSYSDESYTHLCPICHPRTYDLGGNCIWYAWASWRHGAGIGNNCSCDVLNDADCERLREYTYENALALAKRKIGLTDIALIRDNRGLAISYLKPGDIILYYDRNNAYRHTAVYIGDGKIADDSGANSPNIRYGKSYYYDSDRICKVAIRYTGGHTYLTYGDEGTAVAMIQKFLNWWGGYKLNGKGKFGKQTKSAVLKFKGKNAKNDHVGEKTIARMRKVKK